MQMDLDLTVAILLQFNSVFMSRNASPIITPNVLSDILKATKNSNFMKRRSLIVPKHSILFTMNCHCEE